jgi:hypothetical protein
MQLPVFQFLSRIQTTIKFFRCEIGCKIEYFKFISNISKHWRLQNTNYKTEEIRIKTGVWFDDEMGILFPFYGFLISIFISVKVTA